MLVGATWRFSNAGMVCSGDLSEFKGLGIEGLGKPFIASAGHFLKVWLIITFVILTIIGFERVSQIDMKHLINKY